MATTVLLVLRLLVGHELQLRDGREPQLRQHTQTRRSSALLLLLERALQQGSEVQPVSCHIPCAVAHSKLHTAAAVHHTTSTATSTCTSNCLASLTTAAAHTS